MQVANVNVPVKVTGLHVSITDAIKSYAESKVDLIHLDYPRIIDAQVILDVEKHRHLAEVILHCNNHITIEASHECDDMNTLGVSFSQSRIDCAEASMLPNPIKRAA